jgi:hypothetical protein
VIAIVFRWPLFPLEPNQSSLNASVLTFMPAPSHTNSSETRILRTSMSPVSIALAYFLTGNYVNNPWQQNSPHSLTKAPYFNDRALGNLHQGTGDTARGKEAYVQRGRHAPWVPTDTVPRQITCCDRPRFLTSIAILHQAKVNYTHKFVKSVVQWSEFLTAHPEVLGSTRGATKRGPLSPCEDK